MEGAAVTITTILDSVGSVFNSAIGMVGDVAATVAAEPMLLLYAIIPLVGLGVGLFSRLLSVR